MDEYERLKKELNQKLPIGSLVIRRDKKTNQKLEAIYMVMQHGVRYENRHYENPDSTLLRFVNFLDHGKGAPIITNYYCMMHSVIRDVLTDNHSNIEFILPKGKL